MQNESKFKRVIWQFVLRLFHTFSPYSISAEQLRFSNSKETVRKQPLYASRNNLSDKSMMSNRSSLCTHCTQLNNSSKFFDILDFNGPLKKNLAEAFKQITNTRIEYLLFKTQNWEGVSLPGLKITVYQIIERY